MLVNAWRRRHGLFDDPAGGDLGAGGGTGGGGTGSAGVPDFKSFVSGLDEGLRNEPSLAQITDFPTLAKNYVNAEKLIGAKRIALPGENATQAELDAFYQAIGRPETPDSYKIKFKDGFKMGNDDMLKWAKDTFHKVGMSDKAGQQLLDEYADYMTAEANRIDGEMKNTRNQSEVALRKEFGLAYEQNLQIGDNFMLKFASPELVEVFKSSGLVYNPDFVKFCVNAGMKMIEDPGIGGSGAQGLVMTPDQAKGKITELLGNPEFQKQYTDKSDPAHNAAVQKMADLFRYAHPEEAAG